MPKNDLEIDPDHGAVWGSRQGCGQNTRLTGTLEFIRNANEGATLFAVI
jgi:hypothetical protein